MKVKYLKIIFLFTLLSGTALFLISNLINYSDEKIVERIESNLIDQSELLNSHFEMAIREVLSKKSSFENYIYPTYLFKKDKLIKWNDNEFDVRELISSKDSFSITQIRNSTIMFRKKTINIDSVIHTLISFSLIEKGFPFNNQYLAKIPNLEVLPIGVQLSQYDESKDNMEIEFQEKVQFKIDSPNQNTYNPFVLSLIQILTVLFTIGLIAITFLYSMRLADSNKQLIGLLLLSAVMISSRGVMILFNYPNAYLNHDLFRSRIFVSSIVNSSIGDLFLNIVSVLIVVMFLVFNKDWLIGLFKKVKLNSLKKVYIIGLVTFSFFMLQWYFGIVFNLLSNAQISLDIYANVEFTVLSVAAYLSILLFGISYFFINDLIFKIVIKEISEKKKGVAVLLISSVLYYVTASIFNSQFLEIALLQSIYFTLLYYYESPTRVSKFKFGAFLYGLLAIILLACTASIAVYKSFEFKELVKKEKLATKLLIDRDVEGEYLLRNLIVEIQSDIFINSLFVNPQSPKKQIVDRIERYFGYGYFDNYNVKIALFDKEGNSINDKKQRGSYLEIKNDFITRQFKTDLEGVYYQSGDEELGRRRYVCFLDLERYENHTGSVILDLRLKKQKSKSVYPELLLERRFLGKNQFDYAIYNNGKLIYNVGSFNYKIDFNNSLFSHKTLYTNGIEEGGNRHLGVKGKNKTIIITSGIYPYWAILSNFSFYFLLILFGGISTSVINVVFIRNYQTNFSFSTKILIYIGCAFAIPIVFIGFAVISTINTSYKTEIEKSYEKKTISIGENIVGMVGKYLANEVNKEAITNEITKIGKTSRADINIYNVKGKLITTSQPKIFESGLLSTFINSKAYHQIVNQKKDKVVVDESIGNLTYKSSYIAIRAFDDGKLLGIMSSPFFGSKNHLNRQKTEVFNNIINITTLIFIFSIWFTYIAVRKLTNPLILIASKLKKTELKEENEPLVWNTNDEIGILIQEYNKMVVKLGVSKIELAKNEKEAAWREMAKQVAHEIKNPLTPMKLTLQHLDRVMDRDDLKRKSLKSLLSQVDTLDEIVTSFSHFAKMPDPENMDFDIKAELEKITHLHPEKNILFEEKGSFYVVNSDKKLFGRIFNNIILNAFQAMAKVDVPKLDIEISNDNQKVTILFKDNGLGISKEIEEKVFIPNFSTKDSGSGIGLAVAKRGIENAGGTIHFDSVLGEGTVFHIELPLVRNRVGG